jgi:hypothetical protein
MKKISTLLLTLGLLMALVAHAEDGVLDKAGKTVKKGADAAANGIEKGVEATEKGVKKGVEATESGFKKAGEWIDKKTGKTESKSESK